jgi:hypothetical protein
MPKKLSTRTVKRIRRRIFALSQLDLFDFDRNEANAKIIAELKYRIDNTGRKLERAR